MHTTYFLETKLRVRIMTILNLNIRLYILLLRYIFLQNFVFLTYFLINVKKNQKYDLLKKVKSSLKKKKVVFDLFSLKICLGDDFPRITVITLFSLIFLYKLKEHNLWKKLKEVRT